MSRRCGVSWCTNEGKWYIKGNRVTKAGQERFKRSGTAYGEDFYKSYWWICNMHWNDYSDDKAYIKWEKENSIALKIYYSIWR